jgi:putative redox protein
VRTIDFEFTDADEQRLSGRLDLPQGPPQANALFAHCFTCTKNSVAAVRIARALTALGFGVLRFDFTGLGQSGGEIADSTFGGNVEDLRAAARAMAAAGHAPSLLIGHSLGGAAVLAAAAELPSARAIVTIGAPFDVQHVTRLFGDGLVTLLEQGVAEVHLGGRPFRMKRSFIDELRAHDQRQRIADLRRALLVLHAPGDATVDIANAASIFQAAHHAKSFVSLDDADHLLTRPADAEYAARVMAAWATRYLGTAPMRHASDEGAVVVEDTGEGDFQVEVRAPGVHFLADEPVEAGGLGSGPTPYDLLSAGLGACTVMTLRLYARHKAWSLRGVRVRVGHAKRSTDSPPDAFVRTVELDGELDADQRRRLLEIAERCPVHRTLERGARVETASTVRSSTSPAVEDAGRHAVDMDAGVRDG